MRPFELTAPTTAYVLPVNNPLAPDDAARVRPGDYILLEGYTGPSPRSTRRSSR